MRYWLWLVAFLIGCPENTEKHDTAPLTAEQVHADVLAATDPLLGRREYAVTDADIVDPCIATALRLQANRDAVVSSAASCINGKLDEPEGQARVEAKIAQRYAAPVITRDGNEVTIDAGLPTGKLSTFRGATQIESPLLEHGQWQTAEVKRFINLGITKYPDARRYVAKVFILVRSQQPEWRYTFDRDEDRLKVLSPIIPSSVYVSPSLDGNIAHLKSSYTGDLKSQQW